MKQSILINSQDKRKQAVIAVNNITSDPLMQVTIEKAVNTRSVAQNRLYWAFMYDCEHTGVNEQAGKTKDEWHSFFKERALLNIFIRDNVDGTAETMAALYEVKTSCGVDVYNNMKAFVIDKISTTSANVVQFTEYLQDIERFCYSVGIALRTDSQDYLKAMGVKE
ncbi:MAG: recombination protein NinB [Candidatus Obscuribacterales bacterium]|jgi:hypothetical protein